ncbi:MAG: hypothetical protein R3F03_14765 [Opitutaceae bacterium]
MSTFHPRENPKSNRIEAMWYQSWQSGYDDILKRGFPKPEDERTILAELRSPHTDDFLHGGSAEVPFLVSDRARQAFESAELSGFDFGSVMVAKIATKGVRVRRSLSGEPEDTILKSGGVDLDLAPLLHAVRVTASIEVIPDFESGRTPSGWVSPFRLPDVTPEFDLWQPSLRGKRFTAWTYCSALFCEACEEFGLSNIRFEPFEDFMARFRADLEKR